MKNGTVINVFGENIEIVASSTSTNYAFVAGVQTSPPGGGPPLHRHLGEDEVFTVIDGEYEFFDGTSWAPFHRGEVRYSLQGTYHGFRNVGQTAGTLMFTTNGAGLDEYFTEISSLRLPQDMSRLQEISRFYRYEILAPKS
jgi:mannose-6-phosphate isomerase-like protein (cupin superfamily)